MGLVRLGRCPSQCELASWGWGTCPSQLHQHIFFGVKLMFVGVGNFGQVKKIRFVGVKIFRSNSNQFLVIFIWSC